MKITLRPALESDIPVLQRWDQEPSVKSAHGADAWHDWENELPQNADWREILIAECGAAPIGAIEIIDPTREPTQYWGEPYECAFAIDIWIGDEANRRQGHGAAILQAAIRRCFRNEKVEAIIVDPLEANTGAHRFFERCGFEFVERRIFDTEPSVIYRLRRRSWNAQR